MPMHTISAAVVRKALEKSEAEKEMWRRKAKTNFGEPQSLDYSWLLLWMVKHGVPIYCPKHWVAKNCVKLRLFLEAQEDWLTGKDSCSVSFKQLILWG